MVAEVGVWLLMFYSLLATPYSVHGSAAGDATSMDYEYGDINPVFVSQPETFFVKEGDKIVLPCHVQDLGPYPVIWKRGERIISAGPTIVVLDRRYRLLAGDMDRGVSRGGQTGDRGAHSLAIDGVRARDNGTFRCLVSTEPVRELIHTVDVLYGPRVRIWPESGSLVASSGDTVHLKCHAHGKPAPKVYWQKQGESAIFEGDTYNLTGVSHREAGVYQCHAENGVGKKATATVTLHVHYAPVVQVETSSLHTGEGMEVKLACRVNANPAAEVVWSRDGSALDTKRHVQSTGASMTSHDHVTQPQHVLNIKSVRRDDFDTYTCNASNQLGSAKGRMVLTGVADRVSVTSLPIGGAPDTYDLSWQVRSYSSVLEYKVAYRRAKYNTTMDKPSPWKEVIVPNTGAERESGESWGQQQITLRNLEPATLYDLYIQARNKHGWNAVSDMFHFSTISRGAALESRVADSSWGLAAAKQQPWTHTLLVLIVILSLLF